MGTNKYIALIPCAGVGSRFGSTIPKQYLKINGSTILEHTISAFATIDLINEIVIVVNKHDTYIDEINNLPAKVKILKVGGDTRAQSVINGLKELACTALDWILVHDAARCCISSSKIRQMIIELNQDIVGGILAIAATDTIKSVKSHVIESTVPRDSIYLAQTPQMFRYKELYTALTNADIATVTDEASAVEQLGLKVHIVNGEPTNIKVTYPIDIELAQIILKNKAD